MPTKGTSHGKSAAARRRRTNANAGRGASSAANGGKKVAVTRDVELDPLAPFIGAFDFGPPDLAARYHDYLAATAARRRTE